MSDDLQISPEAMAAAYAAFSQSAPDRNAIAKAIYEAFHFAASGKMTDPASEYALKAARAADAVITLVAASFPRDIAIIQLSAQNAELRRKLEAAEVFETMFRNQRDELLQSGQPQANALVKQAFLDGLNYATTCNVKNPEEAWRTSSARARLMRDGTPTPQSHLRGSE
jgi:hypothetical protein